MLTALLLGQGDERARAVVVFSANLVGQWNLYEWSEGAVPRQLTSASGDERSTAASPDGRRIVYATGQAAIRILNRSTSEESAAELPPGRYGSPSWLGDAELIVTRYTIAAGREESDFLRYNVANKEHKSLFFRPGLLDFAMPNRGGERVAYIATLDTRLPEAPPHFSQDLCVTSLLDGDTQRIMVDGIALGPPVWSPSGNNLLLTFQDRGHRSRLMAVDATQGRDLAARSLAAPGSIVAAAWWDDRSILCILALPGGSILQLMNLQGQTIRTLKPFGRPVEIADVVIIRKTQP